MSQEHSPATRGEDGAQFPSALNCVRANAEASPACLEQCRGCSFMQTTLEMLPINYSKNPAPQVPAMATSVVAGQNVEADRASLGDGNEGLSATNDQQAVPGPAVAAFPSATPQKSLNERRYDWLRVRGCAIDGTEALRIGLVRRCINLDEQIDEEMSRE